MNKHHLTPGDARILFVSMRAKINGAIAGNAQASREPPEAVPTAHPHQHQPVQTIEAIPHLRVQDRKDWMARQEVKSGQW